MMNAQPAGASDAARARRSQRERLTHREIAEAVLGVGDSPQARFLIRYAELKSCEPEQLREWLASLAPEQLTHVSAVLAAASLDCEGEVAVLTAQPFRASPEQLKLAPQFWSDGTPFANFRVPRLNTIDAIDDALGAMFVPVLTIVHAMTSIGPRPRSANI